MFDRSVCTAPQYSHYIQVHPSPNLRVAALHLLPDPRNFQPPVALSNSSFNKLICLASKLSIRLCDYWSPDRHLVAYSYHPAEFCLMEQVLKPLEWLNPPVLNKLDQPASLTVNFRYQTAQEATGYALLV